MESLRDIYHYYMTKCITFTVKLLIDVYSTEIPHKYMVHMVDLFLLLKRSDSTLIRWLEGMFLLSSLEYIIVYVSKQYPLL